MTPRELIAEILTQGPSASPTLALECRLIFRVLRDRAHAIVLADGAGLVDGTDFVQLFRELVEELTPPTTCIRRGPAVHRQAQARNWGDTT